MATSSVFYVYEPELRSSGILPIYVCKQVKQKTQWKFAGPANVKSTCTTDKKRGTILWQRKGGKF